MSESRSEDVKVEPLMLTNRRGNEFEIAIDHEGDFMLAITPLKGDAEYIYIDRSQATALRDWLNKAIPSDEIENLRKRIRGYESWERSVNEALNSGDGSYRP